MAFGGVASAAAVGVSRAPVPVKLSRPPGATWHSRRAVWSDVQSQ